MHQTKALNGLVIIKLHRGRSRVILDHNLTGKHAIKGWYKHSNVKLPPSIYKNGMTWQLKIAENAHHHKCKP